MTSPELPLINPATGEVFDAVPMLPTDGVDRVVRTAATAQEKWRRTPVADRITLCEEFLRTLQKDGDTIARHVSMQMGKPLTEALAEFRRAVDMAKALIAMADNALGEVWLAEDGGIERAIRHEPLGVVADIPSWNYPILLPLRTILPAVLGGNAVVLKHSTKTPLTGRALADAFERAGAPLGLVQSVTGDAAVTNALVEHPSVAAIAFTGSAEGGAAIRRQASGHGVHLVSELGGNDAAFVCADADIDAAAADLLVGVFENAGQSAWAVERIYVERPAYEAFAERFAAHARTLVLGDPLSGATTLGPVATQRTLDDLQRVIQEAVTAGAELVVSPGDFDKPASGWYFPPVVLGHAPQQCALMRQECFGPVVGIRPVENDAEAVACMNDSGFGLTASVWTRDADRALLLADALAVGTVYMNETGVLDPALPWAPAKASGQGVTLSPWGLHQFTRPKSLRLRTGSAPR